MRTRLQAKLKEVKQWLREHLHDPIAVVGVHLRACCGATCSIMGCLAIGRRSVCSVIVSLACGYSRCDAGVRRIGSIGVRCGD